MNSSAGSLLRATVRTTPMRRAARRIRASPSSRDGSSPGSTSGSALAPLDNSSDCVVTTTVTVARGLCAMVERPGRGIRAVNTRRRRSAPLLGFSRSQRLRRADSNPPAALERFLDTGHLERLTTLAVLLLLHPDRPTERSLGSHVRLTGRSGEPNGHLSSRRAAPAPPPGSDRTTPAKVVLAITDPRLPEPPACAPCSRCGQPSNQSRRRHVMTGMGVPTSLTWVLVLIASL
jgi:hypothetical protein